MKTPLTTIQKLVSERYNDASAIFWAGSVAQGKATKTSDLDLVVVHEEIHGAYREAFIYEDWPIDAFIHDSNSLRYFFEEAKNGNGIPGTISMILTGIIIIDTEFAKEVKKLAQSYYEAGPAKWSKKEIDKERFFITDKLDDIKFSVSRAEQIASVVWLYEALGQFYFRAQNKWCASGKSLIRYLETEDLELAEEFTQGFEQVFKNENIEYLIELVEKILTPYGGLLWDGFNSNSKKS